MIKLADICNECEKHICNPCARRDHAEELLEQLWTWATTKAGQACCGESQSCYEDCAVQIERMKGLDPWAPKIARRRTGTINAVWEAKHPEHGFRDTLKHLEE